MDIQGKTATAAAQLFGRSTENQIESLLISCENDGKH